MCCTYPNSLYHPDPILHDLDVTKTIIGLKTTDLPPLNFPKETLSPTNKEGTPHIQSTFPIFEHSPPMTVFLDGVEIKCVVDTSVDAPIVFSNDSFCHTHWSYVPTFNIKGVGGLQTPHQVKKPIRWKDHEENTGILSPMIAEVHNTLWGWDHLTAIDIVLTTEDLASSLSGSSHLIPQSTSLYLQS